MRRTLITVLVATALTACGGGGSSDGGATTSGVAPVTNQPTPPASGANGSSNTQDPTQGSTPPSTPTPPANETPAPADPDPTYAIDTSASAIEFVQDWNSYPDGAYTEADILRDFDCPATNTFADFCHEPQVTVQELAVDNGRLKVTFDAGEVNLDNGIFMQKRFPADWDELYLTYEIEYAGDFDQMFRGGKIIGLGGTAPETWTPPVGGAEAPVDGGFSSRFMFRQQGQLITYVYHQDNESTDDYGERNFIPGFNFQVGETYILEMRVVMNDPGESNGYIETRINNELVQVDSDYTFSESGMYDVNTLIFNISTGGNNDRWAPANSSTLWIDNLVVSTESVVMEQ